MNIGPRTSTRRPFGLQPGRSASRLGFVMAWLLAGCLETTFNPPAPFATDALDAAIEVDSLDSAPVDATQPDAGPEAEAVAPDLPDLPDTAEVEEPDVADVLDVVEVQQDVTELVDATPDVEETGPVGLPFGATCTTDADCESTACNLTSGDAGFCTKICTGDCPEGFRCGIDPSSGSTTVHYCLALPADLCKPCTLDTDCEGGACLTLESTGLSLCGSPCGPDTSGVCPAGFVCQSFLKGEQCVPAPGTCSCGVGQLDTSWACALETPLGKCFGAQLCGETGWSTCSAQLPTAELCDAIDNDCNGQTDESFTALGSPCGVGICAGGKLVCATDTKKLACSTDTKKLKVESCGDALDNNCNGQTDEACPPKDVDGDGSPDLQDCAPYQPEIFPGAKEPCCAALPASTGTDTVPVTPQTKPCDRDCDGKVIACAGNDKDGDGFAPPEDCDDTKLTVFPGAAEKCGDAIDQDCSGADLKCDPTLDADGDGYLDKQGDCEDDAAKIFPGAPEVCNDIDDDCDGVVDDGNPGGGAACGPSKGACKPGTMVCSHVGLVAQVTCTDAQGGEPEMCNSLDDNCDGNTDEDFLDLGQACDTDDADQCKHGKYGCSVDGLGVACLPEKTTDLLEMCKTPGSGNDLDEDCDGLTDEVCFGDDTDGDGVIGPADCNPLDAGFRPGAKESCCDPALGTTDKATLAICDANCDGNVTPCDAKDLDFDGYFGDQDCNEADPLSHIGAPERCGDDIDQDCDGKDLDCATIIAADEDGDGFPAGPGLDCKPFDKNIHPHALEICNNKDDDCDGVVDEGNPEASPGACGSSQGLCQAGQEACVHIGFKAVLVCVPQVAPAAEACNGQDDNCNGKTDEYFTDLGKPCDGSDADDCENGVYTCALDGTAETCASESITDIPELCDGLDNDCDGKTDEAMTYFGKKLGETCQGLGACGKGVVVCSPELQVAVCSTDAYGTESKAVLELCDGVDNDCDGFTDEGMLFAGKPLGAACIGNGECGKAAGAVECSKSGVAICSTMLGGSKYQGKPEQCDGIDNNCDGHVDEGMGVKDSTCKQTGLCNTANVLASCKLGKWQCNYSAVVGYQGDSEVFCDAIDNDCDGKTDDEFSVGLACDTTDTDLCPNGVVVCSEDKLFSLCGAETQTDIVEACDALDNDCDAKTDEDFPVGEACDGVDKDQCKNGSWTCTSDGKQAECKNESQVDIVDACNAQDDDCDGQTDEDFADLGQECDGNDTDQCTNGLFECTGDGKATTCGAESIANIAEVCDGKDNDCDGQTDEGQLYDGKGLGGDCKGIGACGAGKVVCSPTTKEATCSTNPDAYLIFEGKELCDGLDNDCNGETDDALAWKGKSLKEVCEGIGECGAGVVECGNDKQVTCSTLKNGTSSKVKPEVCDGKDNDCNGETDTGLTVQDSPCLKVGVCASDKLQAACEGGSWKCTYANIGGWQADETLCDGLDNDCDGQTDESFDIGKACDSDDSDSCKTGTWSCSADGAQHVCINESLTNIPEVCDGADNDCDGATDEDFTYSGGKLGDACKGFGACGAGKIVCSKDNQIATCSTNPDGTISQAKPEECDAQDNDCNGKTDDGLKFNGLPIGAPCSGIGECGLGQVVCTPAKVAVCSTNPDGPQSQAKPELCDGKDNDCNAQTDENLDLKKSTCPVAGVCALALTPACVSGAWKCSYAGFGYEAKETLCDQKDNDCNGVTDDPYPNRGKACDGPDADSCKFGVFVCSVSQLALECGPESGAPTAEICDGKDNDCNGATDELFPELGQACDGSDKDECPNGSWECSTDGKSVQCVNEFVVDLIEACDYTDNDCDGLTDENMGVGEPCDGPDTDKCAYGMTVCGSGGKVECGAESKSNVLEICNAKDDNCDGVTDEGFEQKGIKCDLPSDNDACETGSYQCTMAGTMTCVGDVPCVSGTQCKIGKSATELDQCLCGTSFCSTAQGSTCAADGKCTCLGAPACPFGKTCTATGCK